MGLTETGSTSKGIPSNYDFQNRDEKLCFQNKVIKALTRQLCIWERKEFNQMSFCIKIQLDGEELNGIKQSLQGTF